MDYRDVNIATYKKVEAILKDEEEIDFIKEQQLYALISGTPHRDILDWKGAKWKKEKKKLDFLNSQPNKLYKYTRINGRKFRAILNVYGISFGLYIDIIELSKENPTDNMEKLMALLYEEKRTWYSFWRKKLTYEQRAELFLDSLTMDRVLPHMVFFSKVLIGLMPHIPAYLEEMLTTTKERTQTSRDTMAGA